MTYDHHPDPAIAFCIEADILEGMEFDARHGIIERDVFLARLDRALQFKVGGDAYAIQAKDRLRQLRLDQ